jgi:hypothetical protein
MYVCGFVLIVIDGGYSRLLTPFNSARSQSLPPGIFLETLVSSLLQMGAQR